MPTANILDPIQDTLDSTVWNHPGDAEPVLKPVHAHFIAKIIYGILEKGGYPKPHEWLKLYFTGSLCTYQYSEASDADVSLFVQSDKLPEWSRAEMIGLMIEGCDGVTLPGTIHELQGYVVARGVHPADLYKPGLRAGYSIDDHHWFTPPDRSLAHDVQSQENGFYVWAMTQADKMERLLRYEPDKAVDFWHQIHRKRMRDQTAGKGDVSESNILYKFLAHRNLLPQIAEVSGEHIARVSAMTRKQLLELASTLPEDQSEVVHQFPDNWTIRQLKSYGDMHREGMLMGNCYSPMASDYPHAMWGEHPMRSWDYEDGPHEEDLTPRVLGTPLPATHYSLRDPDNLPHVSYDPERAEEGEMGALGRHNYDPKPEYEQRIAEWLSQRQSKTSTVTYECPHCAQEFHDNGWTGYTPMQDGEYGERTWTCPNCQTDMREVVNRPVPKTGGWQDPAEIVAIPWGIPSLTW